MICFIQVGTSGPIKIGYSAKPKTRMRDLQVGNPEELRMVCTFTAPRIMESALHSAFSPYRIRGEWFTPGRRLLLFIALCNRLRNRPKSVRQNFLGKVAMSLAARQNPSGTRYTDRKG